MNHPILHIQEAEIYLYKMMVYQWYLLYTIPSYSFSWTSQKLETDTLHHILF